MDATELRQRRLALGLDQAQLAALLKTPYGTYRGWETGRREMPPVVDVALSAVEKDREAELCERQEREREQ